MTIERTPQGGESLRTQARKKGNLIFNLTVPPFILHRKRGRGGGEGKKRYSPALRSAPGAEERGGENISPSCAKKGKRTILLIYSLFFA